MRRISAAAVLAVCLIALPGQAFADDPSFSVAGASGAEGTTANFVVTFTDPVPEGGYTLDYSVTHGTTSAADFSGPTSGSVTLAAGATGATIHLELFDDTLDELAETFVLNVSKDATGTNTANGTILTDDSDSQPATTSVSDVTVTEGNSGNVAAKFTVQLSGASGKPITVRYSTANGTATPSDYVPQTNQAITIPAGQTSGTISINVTGDTLPEDDEFFFVNLLSGTNVTIGGDTEGEATITDDDAPVSASINDVAVTEGNAGTVNATFTVTLSGPAAAPVQIRYSTVDGSAEQPGDYTAVTNATLPIAQGASSGQFSIVVKGDTLPEGSGSPLAENFFVDLISATGPATISADSRGTGKIVDDDNPVSASINDVAVSEGNSGTVNATFTVLLSGPAPAPVQIRYSSVNGSAFAPSDYNAVTNALLPIAQGASSGQFSIVVKGDMVPEGTGSPLAEDFFVDLISATGPVTISADSRGRGAIVDDDTPVSASINDVSVTEGNSGTVNATFTVSLSGGAPAPVQIQYSTLSGSAAAPDDYTAVTNATLNIAQGATSGQFNIIVKGDTSLEGTGDPRSENFFVVISATGATLADSSGIGTIVDDETPPPSGGGGGGGSGDATLPALTISDTAAREGQAANFTVTLLGTTAKTVTVVFSTGNGTAQAGSDYEARVGTLTFGPGETTQTISVTVLDDTVPEGSEVFHLSLSNQSNATTIKSLGTATIEASDQATTAGPKSPNTPKPTLLPRIVLGPPSVTIDANGIARMHVTCLRASPITCVGSVALETTVKPKFELGKKTFSMKKGKKVFIQIKLSARALKLLMKTGTLKVRVVVVVKNSKKKNQRFFPGVVTLKASKALALKLGGTKTVEVKSAEETPAAPPTLQPKPTPKPKPAPLPPIKVEIVP